MQFNPNPSVIPTAGFCWYSHHHDTRHHELLGRIQQVESNSHRPLIPFCLEVMAVFSVTAEPATTPHHPFPELYVHIFIPLWGFTAQPQSLFYKKERGSALHSRQSKSLMAGIWEPSAMQVFDRMSCREINGNLLVFFTVWLFVSSKPLAKLLKPFITQSFSCQAAYWHGQFHCKMSNYFLSKKFLP